MLSHLKVLLRRALSRSLPVSLIILTLAMAQLSLSAFRLNFCEFVYLSYRLSRERLTIIVNSLRIEARRVAFCGKLQSENNRSHPKLIEKIFLYSHSLSLSVCLLLTVFKNQQQTNFILKATKPKRTGTRFSKAQLLLDSDRERLEK